MIDQEKVSQLARAGFDLWQAVDAKKRFLSTDGRTIPYRFNLQTRELVRVMPPGFTSVGHITRAKNGLITFDSKESGRTENR